MEPNLSFFADDDPVLEGSALDAAVNNNADAQAEKFDPDTKVVAQIIDQEPAAELANGDADLSTTGQATSTWCQNRHILLHRLAIGAPDLFTSAADLSTASVAVSCRYKTAH